MGRGVCLSDFDLFGLLNLYIEEGHRLKNITLYLILTVIYSSNNVNYYLIDKQLKFFFFVRGNLSDKFLLRMYFEIDLRVNIRADLHVLTVLKKIHYIQVKF